MKKVLPAAVQRTIIIAINMSVMTKVNFGNKLAYGRNAPRYGERIWVNPSLIRDKVPIMVRQKYFRTIHVPEGAVIGGDWDQQGLPIELQSVFRACRDHWINGVPWEQTGRYEVMLKEIRNKGDRYSGCANLGDIVARYRKLDKIYEEIRAEKRFQTGEEKNSGKGKILSLHKKADVVICIDRHGVPLLAGDGQHRVSIAKILELPVIPAVLGVVHPQGLKYLDSYRKPPRDE